MTRSEKRLFVLGSVVFLVLAGLALGDRDQGLPELLRRRVERQRLQAEIQQLRERRDALSRQVLDLRENPRAIERRAREDLGMIRKGETVFLLPERDAPNR